MKDDAKWNRKISLSPGFRLQWEEAQNCHVLLFPEGMLQLNPTASEILGLCDGKRSPAKIIEELQKKYPEADLAQDVHEFIEDCYARGWIR